MRCASALAALSLSLVPLGAGAAIEAQNVPPEPASEPPRAPVLTRAPELLLFVAAAYPEDLLVLGRGGEVTLGLDIDAQGAVTAVDVVASTDAAFTAPAVAAGGQFQCSPAEVDGVPTAIRIEYRYVF
ncbi:MAG: TonB family protein [Deltaproteobacteria bacterium]|nr:TonB family protein [Deltaproteobacteria bacterium]